MAKFDPYDDSTIKRGDTDPAELKQEQLQTLANWCGWHPTHLFDGLPLRLILAAFHASIEWDTIVGWLEEEPQAAVAAWNAIMPPDHHLAER